MSDRDRLADAMAMVRAGRSDAEIEAALEVTPLELLELRAELATSGTVLRGIIPNFRAAPRARRGLLKWFGPR